MRYLRTIRVPRRLLAAAGTLLVAGCGEDPVAPGEASIEGTWTYELVEAVGSGINCTLTGVTLTFERSADTLNGSVVAAGTNNLACSSSTGTRRQDFGGSAPLSGVVLNGNEVGFVLGSLAGNWVHTGSVDGNTMEGSATILLRFSGTTYTLDGSWSAVRVG